MLFFPCYSAIDFFFIQGHMSLTTAGGPSASIKDVLFLGFPGHPLTGPHEWTQFLCCVARCLCRNFSIKILLSFSLGCFSCFSSAWHPKLACSLSHLCMPLENHLHVFQVCLPLHIWFNFLMPQSGLHTTFQLFLSLRCHFWSLLALSPAFPFKAASLY